MLIAAHPIRRILVVRLQVDASHTIVVLLPDGTCQLSRPDLTEAQVRTWLLDQTPGVDYVPHRSDRNVLADVVGEPCLRWSPRWAPGGLDGPPAPAAL